MISPCASRVQAIKSKFENLGNDSVQLRTKNTEQLPKHPTSELYRIKNYSLPPNEAFNSEKSNKNNENYNNTAYEVETNESTETDTNDLSPKPNISYLYNRNEVKRSLSDPKKSLTRQCSDPVKKLHRSHAFRCDKAQKINISPKRHGSCNGRSETSDFSLKMAEKGLSEDRLRKLGNLLEDQMRKEGFVPSIDTNDEALLLPESIPDEEVPKHILDQYAKVNKQKKKEDNIQDTMTDSGVSSETENLDEEKNRVKHLKSQFESQENIPLALRNNNLESMDQLCISSETMRLERKNPHLKLTDTLKKALKQPLPIGPPPKKPPRTFNDTQSPDTDKKKDTRHMIEKLEKALQKREAHSKKNLYDVAEEDLSKTKPKEMHYLCTEILDIHNRGMSDSNCFNPFSCAIPASSTMSLPYARLTDTNLEATCSCSNENLARERFKTFFGEKCPKCEQNEQHDSFKCHLDCKCKDVKSTFYVEPIYDEPCVDVDGVAEKQTNNYGTLLKPSLILGGNNVESKSEEISEINKIYDTPCESRSPTPDVTRQPKTNFKTIRESFENGRLAYKMANVPAKTSVKMSKSTENLSDGVKNLRKSCENKFGTDARRYRKFENKETNSRCSRKDYKQLEVDKENLNRLMNEIYDTVTAACNMDENKPGHFPTETSDGSTSEDSVKLTRSLTEKRKNYVRRMSSRVAYLDAKNIKSIKNTRFRHQTSICSYKSDIVDNSQLIYNTFRSWKSFRASQSQFNLSENNMADRRETTDSKFNLTDSRGNILSMKDEFSSSVDSIDNMSIDEKTGCVDIDLPFEPRERGLFNVCLLVGLNYMSGEAYVKSVFPNQVQVPPHIENLIFPETLNTGSKSEWVAEAKSAQCYSLVLTDERGERSYGYCRRVLPEGATTCLPLCYCLIGKYRSPGFYYKILQEIESHHGSSDTEINTILQQLFETDFPLPGEEITIKHHKQTHKQIGKPNRNVNLKSQTMPDTRMSDKFQDSNFNLFGSTEYLSGIDHSFSDKVNSLGDKVNSFGDKDNSLGEKENLCNGDLAVEFWNQSDPNLTRDDLDYDTGLLPDYYDLESMDGRKVTLNLQGERIKSIKMPLEPRVDENNLSVLLDSLGTGLVIKVFGSLLLERKVVIVSDQLNQVSSCMEALQSILYPFVWQQPLISTIPSEIRRDVLEAPLPMLAGVLKTGSDDVQPGLVFEEGMLIDLTHPTKVIYYQGDESTILPTSSYKTLKTSLQMETGKNKERQEDKVTRNVMISETFLRFFVDILKDFWKFLSFGELKDGCLGKGNVIFDKEAFIKNASSKQNQYFLEWFTETAMFTHFVQNMAVLHQNHHAASDELNLVDIPYPNYYELFEERINSRTKSVPNKSVDAKSNVKSAMNRKVRHLKNKLRDLIS